MNAGAEQAFAPGASAGEAFAAGANVGGVHLAGAAAGEIHVAGTRAAEAFAAGAAAAQLNLRLPLWIMVTHKHTHDPEDGSDPLDCAAAPEIAGVQAAGEGSAHSFARSDHAHQIQHGITDNHIATIDHAAAANDDYAKFTADGLEGRSYAEVRSDLNVGDGADVAGPASSTHHAIARWYSTGGKTLQDSEVEIDNSGNVVLPTAATLTVRDIVGDSAVLYISCDKAGVASSVSIRNSDGSQVCNMSIDGTITSGNYLVVTKELWNANTIVAANTNNAPVPVLVAEQRLVGRITSGNIDDLTATQVRTLINVEDDADVTDATNVDAAGATMNSDVQSKGVYVTDPADDEDLPFFHTPVAITVTAIFGETDTGTVTLRMKWRPEGAAFADGWQIESTQLVADSDEQRQTSGFEDATIPAGSYIVLVTSAVADSPTKLIAGIEFTVD